MAKTRKRRTKSYAGWDAAAANPTVHRIKAVQRSRLGQWRHDNRRMIKVWLIVGLVVAILVLVISGIISLFT